MLGSSPPSNDSVIRAPSNLWLFHHQMWLLRSLTGGERVGLRETVMGEAWKGHLSLLPKIHWSGTDHTATFTQQIQVCPGWRRNRFVGQSLQPSDKGSKAELELGWLSDRWPEPGGAWRPAVDHQLLLSTPEGHCVLWTDLLSSKNIPSRNSVMTCSYKRRWMCSPSSFEWTHPEFSG